MQQLIKVKHTLYLESSEGIEKQKELHNTLTRMILSFNERYGDYNLMVSIDNTGKIYVSTNGQIPLDEYLGMMREMDNCRSTYGRMNHYNKKAEGKVGKHNSHLIRVLEEGEEFCETGKFSVIRPNADWHRKVRNGEISQEEIFALAEEKNAKLMRYTKDCALPMYPEHEAIDELYCELVLMYNKDMGFI